MFLVTWLMRVESNMKLKMDQLFYMQKSPYNLDGNHPDEICLISSS